MTDFKTNFSENYLKFVLGSIPKSDIDALIVHLIGLYDVEGSPPL